MVDPFAPEIFPKVLANYATWQAVVDAVDTLLPPEVTSNDRKDYVARLAPNDVNNMGKLMAALVAHLNMQGWTSQFQVALFRSSAGSPTLRGLLRGEIFVNDEGIADPGAVQSLQNRVEPFLNSKAFFDVMEAARYRVCGIWVHDKKGNTRSVVGTGFLIAPDLVLTARHVVKPLIDEIATGRGPEGIETRDEALVGSEAQLACVFDYWTQTGKFCIEAPPPGVNVVMAAPNWLQWSSLKHPGDGVTHQFGPPNVAKRLDCAVIRLSKRIGATATTHSGGKMRGWLPLNGAIPAMATGNAIAILQHPAGGPQMFDKGDFQDQDVSLTRIWYLTEAAQGSSGSPCFDSEPSLVAFHNAGRPNAFDGATKDCNQGIRIDHVINAMPVALVNESQKGVSIESALWSASDDPEYPEPILGRTDFKQAVFSLFDPRATERLLIVEEADDVRATGKSGKSFSARILKAIGRNRPCIITEFEASKVRGLAPETFLAELGRRLGIHGLEKMPKKSTDERQPTRFYSNDLPKWFGELIEERARAAGSAVNEAVADPSTGAATGQELVARELIWIVIDDIHKDPPEGDIRELLAGLMGVTDTQHVLGPGLKALRWLIIGHVPDFVREKSIQYKHDEVSQKTIGSTEWSECIGTALISLGEKDRFNAESARLLYEFAKLRLPEVNNPALMLQQLSIGVVDAVNLMRKGG